METVGEPVAFYPKSLKIEPIHPQRTEVSRSTTAEKNSISRAAFGYFPDDAVNSIAIKTSPCLANYNAATKPENPCD